MHIRLRRVVTHTHTHRPQSFNVRLSEGQTLTQLMVFANEASRTALMEFTECTQPTASDAPAQPCHPESEAKATADADKPTVPDATPDTRTSVPFEDQLL